MNKSFINGVVFSVATVLSASTLARPGGLDQICENPPTDRLKELCESRGNPEQLHKLRREKAPASQQIMERCENPPPAMKAFCEGAMKGVQSLPKGEETQSKKPNMSEQQKDLVQKSMLQQDVWTRQGHGTRVNNRFFRTGDELKSFYEECADKGGVRGVPEGSSQEVVYDLYRASCWYPNTK